VIEPLVEFSRPI